MIGLIYLPSGKDIKPRNGLILPLGTTLQLQGKWITLNSAHIVSVTTTWDNLSQSRDTNTNLIAL